MKLVYSRLLSSPCPHPPKFICLLQNARGLMFPVWKREEEVLSWLYVLQDSAGPCLFPSFSSMSSGVLIFRQVFWLTALGSPPLPAESALFPLRSHSRRQGETHCLDVPQPPSGMLSLLPRPWGRAAAGVSIGGIPVGLGSWPKLTCLCQTSLPGDSAITLPQSLATVPFPTGWVPWLSQPGFLRYQQPDPASSYRLTPLDTDIQTIGFCISFLLLL